MAGVCVHGGLVGLDESGVAVAVADNEDDGFAMRGWVSG